MTETNAIPIMWNAALYNSRVIKLLGSDPFPVERATEFLYDSIIILMENSYLNQDHGSVMIAKIERELMKNRGKVFFLQKILSSRTFLDFLKERNDLFSIIDLPNRRSRVICYRHTNWRAADTSRIMQSNYHFALRVMLANTSTK